MSRIKRPELSLSLQFADASHRAVLPRHKVARWIRAALEAPAEITVRVVGAEEARELNRDYRQKDYATNVLTFDYSHAPLVAADLVLCAPVVAQEAQELGVDVAGHPAQRGAGNRGVGTAGCGAARLAEQARQLVGRRLDGRLCGCGVPGQYQARHRWSRHWRRSARLGLSCAAAGIPAGVRLVGALGRAGDRLAVANAAAPLAMIWKSVTVFAR